MNETLIEKLNRKFPTARGTVLARTGDWDGAAAEFAGMAVWGVWAECRNEAGLPSDAAAKSEIVAAYHARRAAKFAK